MVDNASRKIWVRYRRSRRAIAGTSDRHSGDGVYWLTPSRACSVESPSLIHLNMAVVMMMRQILNVVCQRSDMVEAGVFPRDIDVTCIKCWSPKGRPCFDDELVPTIHNVRLTDLNRRVPDHSATEFWLWGLSMVFLVAVVIPFLIYVAHP